MDLYKLVASHYEELNESDFYIWNYICTNWEECAKATVEDLGKKCHVSRSTIMRFAQKLGMSGFSELKYHLKTESKRTQFNEGGRVDVSLMFESHAKMLTELLNRNYRPICQMIHEARRIFVVASGSIQKSVAKELSRQFLKMQVIMTVISGTSEIKMLEQVVEEQDVLVLISLTGENKEMIDLVKKAKMIGTQTISITQVSANSLSLLAEEPIYIFSGNVPRLFDVPYVSPTMFFAITELLFVHYYNYREELKTN